MEPGTIGPVDIAWRIAAAALGGFCLGIDRELRRKPLGLRTFMLVSIGSAAFVITAVELAHGLAAEVDGTSIDPTRVIQGVITGIGFLGAGAILQGRDRIIGATTGASIWVVGAIGVACGFGLYWHAAICAVAALFVLIVMSLVETKVLRRRSPEEGDDDAGADAGNSGDGPLRSGLPRHRRRPFE